MSLCGLEITIHKYDETSNNKIIAHRDAVVLFQGFSDDPEVKYAYFQVLKQNDDHYDVTSDRKQIVREK